MEAYYFADGRGLSKQPRSVIYHWNQYDKEIKVYERPSVCLFVVPFVIVTKNAYSFIIHRRAIISISGKRSSVLYNNRKQYLKSDFEAF